MRPYQTKKLTEEPDMGDIWSEGRASHVGVFLQGKNVRGRGEDFRRSQQPKNVKVARRNMKRADKAKVNKQLAKDEN